MDHASPGSTGYRGRLAPSPTGYLHLGHARTFWIAQERTRAARGTLVLRNEDLDSTRFQMQFVDAMIEDLKWFGFEWQEGPDCGGPFAPYNQSERVARYQAAFEALRSRGLLYPCTCSRKDIRSAAAAPHDADESEPIYPGTCRARNVSDLAVRKFAWRFRIPDGEAVSFRDGHFGLQTFAARQHFGDFVVWRSDGVPSYQLACVVDDAAMGITEVVRGADLLLSTARQLLLFRALGLNPPAFHHCPLMTDASGVRLAKRHDALSLRRLRESGMTPEKIRESWENAASTGAGSSEARLGNREPF
jgi:glutamyl/glutaminyl-tRNA synthetase